MRHKTPSFTVQKIRSRAIKPGLNYFTWSKQSIQHEFVDRGDSALDEVLNQLKVVMEEHYAFLPETCKKFALDTKRRLKDMTKGSEL